MIKYLYYALPFSLAFGVLTKITLFPSVNIYAQDLIVLLIILFSLKDIVRFLKKINRFVILFFVFSIISISSLIFNTSNLFEFGSSISYLFRLGLYFSIIIPLLNFNKSSTIILRKIMILSGFLFVLFGYIQYFYYPNLRNLYYLGWDDHLYRLFSTFLDPNFAGIFIVLVILIYSVFFFEKFIKSSSKQKIILLLGYVFIVPSLLLTYSRSSLISGIISIIIFLLLSGKKQFVIFSVLTFMILLFLLPKNLSGEGVNLFRTYSTKARLAQYNNAFEIFTDHPLNGVGFNSLRFTSAKYGFLEPSQMLTSHSAAGIPNSYLTLLATTGVIGFGIFIIFICKIVINTWKLKNKLYLSTLIAMISAILIDSLFENALLFAPVMLWLILSFGVLYNAGKAKGNI